MHSETERGRRINVEYAVLRLKSRRCRSAPHSSPTKILNDPLWADMKIPNSMWREVVSEMIARYSTLPDPSASMARRLVHFYDRLNECREAYEDYLASNRERSETPTGWRLNREYYYLETVKELREPLGEVWRDLDLYHAEHLHKELLGEKYDKDSTQSIVLWVMKQPEKFVFDDLAAALASLRLFIQTTITVDFILQDKELDERGSPAGELKAKGKGN
jgi:hypothetical protein